MSIVRRTGLRYPTPVNTKHKPALLILLVVAMAIPFVGFILYIALHFPPDHWPLWSRMTILIWFVAMFVIPQVLVRGIYGKRLAGSVATPSTTVVLDAKKESILGGSCYIAGVLFPILFLMAEPFKSNRFVRFHAFQATLFWAIICILLWVDSYPRWNSLAGILWPIVLVTWIVTMVKAYRGKEFHLPIIGNLAERLANRLVRAGK